MLLSVPVDHLESIQTVDQRNEAIRIPAALLHCEHRVSPHALVYHGLRSERTGFQGHVRSFKAVGERGRGTKEKAAQEEGILVTQAPDYLLLLVT
ncbi:hypothetical protein ACRRTK_012961 [Alexandromys fortis]